MIKLIILLAVLVLPVFARAQNSRFDTPIFSGPQTTIQWCQHPANGVPCSNFATTYNSLGAACPNNAQDTPQPQPSNCQSTLDARGNVGIWAPAGTYDYTYCIGSGCVGPNTVTIGGGGGGGTLNDPGSNSIPYRYAPTLTQPATYQNILSLWSGCSGSLIPSANGSCVPLPSAASTVPFGLVVTNNSISNLSCNGTTDDTAALNTLLTAIGSTPTKLIFPNTGKCVLGNVVLPANVVFDPSSGGALQAESSPVSPGGGAFVQSHGTNNSAILTASCAVTLTGTVAGNTILFMGQQYNGDSVTRTMTTPSDGHNTYVPIFATDTSHASRAYAWFASNIAGGTVTVTAPISTPSTNNQNSCFAMEVSGVGATPKAYFANGSGSAGTTMSAGPSTIPAGTFLASFGGQPYVNETCTAGAGYTQPAGDGGSLTGQLNIGAPGGPGESLCSQYLNSSAGGSTSASMTLSTDMTGFWLHNLIGLAPGSSTIGILGQIINPDLHQIFFNALGGSQGAIDFTGSNILSPVYPEWWGASPQASASVNTPALQAAIWAAFGCGPVQCRTNGSGLKQYNRELRLSGYYNINGELQTYHMIGFLWSGVGMNNSGIIQTASNARILDGQNVAYGAFNNMSFSTTASQDVSHPLIDFEAGGQGVDLFDQFVTFNSDVISCGNVGAVGVEISPNGESNGNNFNFNNVAGKSCTTAIARIGDPSDNAFNALSNIWYGGDVQGGNLYGLAAYGGQWIVHGTTMENGTTAQTGYDVFCSTSQLPCILDGVRSESLHMMASEFPSITDSKTIFQGLTWDQGNLAGTTCAVSELITGDRFSGDGAYYQCTIAGTLGGLNSTAATSGSATTIVCSGCTWTVNQWTGQRAGIISGTGAGSYGVISSNTATTITVASWINNTPTNWGFYSAAPPDATSLFVVEPNWGVQTTSGSATFAAISGYVVDGTSGSPVTHAYIQNSQFIGLPINVNAGTVRDSIFSRRDFIPTSANASLNTLLTRVFSNNQVYLPAQGTLGPNGIPQTYPLTTSASPITATAPWNLGSMPLIWSCSSARGGGTACSDVGIGGRSDPGATTTAYRNFVEVYGGLGPPTPFNQTNANSKNFPIYCGLGTGTGTSGICQFWAATPGSSGVTPETAAQVATVDSNGFNGPHGLTTPALGAFTAVSLSQYLSTVGIPNASSTGTTLNSLAKVTGAPSKAVIAATTDTNGVVGIVVTGAGTTGNAGIATNGIAACTFDGATTAGDYVQISSSTGGDCHDAGSTFPATNQVLGIVLASIGGTGLANVVLGTDIEGGQLMGSSTLAGLGDVKITAVADTQVLTYVAADSKWENKAGSGAGGTFQANGVNLSGMTTINFQDSAATNGVTYHFTNPSVGNVQLSVTGTLGLGGGGLGITSGTSGGIPYFASTSTTASSAALALGQFVLGGGAGSSPTTANLSGDVATSGSAATTIQPNVVNSSKMAVVNNYRICGMVFGSDNPAGAVLASADIAPQVSQCFIPAAATVIEVDVYGDAGASSVTVARNRGGSVTALTSSQLASAAAGARACSNAGGTAGLGSGAPTCSGTLSTTALAAGDTIQTSAATADGVSRSLKVFVTFTIN